MVPQRLVSLVFTGTEKTLRRFRARFVDRILVDAERLHVFLELAADIAETGSQAGLLADFAYGLNKIRDAARADEIEAVEIDDDLLARLQDLDEIRAQLGLVFEIQFSVGLQ